MKKKAYIHIGLHKTGSTSLQKFIKINEKILLENDIYIPKSCRVWGEEIINHHNLAEELIDSKLFSKENNSFKDLLNEIKNVEKDILLSSEDFSKLVSFPDKLIYFINQLKQLNFEIKFIVYTRYSSNYLRSLFFQLKTVKLIKYTKLFNFIYQMNKKGYYELNSGVKCYVDSSLFLNDWGTISKEKISIINYDEKKEKIFEEFISVIMPNFSFEKMQNKILHLNTFKKNFFQPVRLFAYLILNIFGHFVLKKKR